MKNAFVSEKKHTPTRSQREPKSDSTMTLMMMMTTAKMAAMTAEVTSVTKLEINEQKKTNKKETMASVIGIVPGRVIREIRISNFLSDASFLFYFLFFSLFFLATAAATAAAAAVAVVVVVVVRRCWF